MPSAPVISSTELAAALVESSRLDALIDRYGAEAVLAAAEAEGVDRLIAEQRSGVPAFSARRREAALEDAVKIRETARVASAIADAGVRVAVFKGASLAVTHYEQSWLRPRIDLDLLIVEADRARAAAVLTGLGYARAGRIEGRWISRQDAWTRENEARVPLAVDLHWDATNRVHFNSRFPAATLLARAIAAPFAGGGVVRLDDADQLLVACLHRAAHHSDRMKVIWLCDEWRLAALLTPADVDVLCARAIDGGVACLIARDLGEARGAFGTGGGALDLGVIDRLAAAGRRETSRRFLAARGRAGDLWLDLRSLSRWRDRRRLLQEHLAPSSTFMDGPGSANARGWLPWRYARRVVLGACRWTREAFWR